MANLRNKKKLVAVPREQAENTRSSQSQNTLDPGRAQEYMSHVSEEIEGRVTKNFPEKSAGRNHILWVLCLCLMKFFWTHKFGLFPQLFREHPETAAQKTEIPLGIVLRANPVLQWCSLPTSLVIETIQSRKRLIT